jgi:hypothetical protein
MVGRSSGTLPTRIQILVLAPFSGFSRIYRCYALSGKRRSCRRRGAIGDFRNLQICRCSVFRRCSWGRVCVRVLIGVSVHACCERLRCTMSFSKKLLISDDDACRKRTMLSCRLSGRSRHNGRCDDACVWSTWVGPMAAIDLHLGSVWQGFSAAPGAFLAKPCQKGEKSIS